MLRHVSSGSANSFGIGRGIADQIEAAVEHRPEHDVAPGPEVLERRLPRARA